jgi:ssDNA-binding Zn-finger/Zn-ribbon topoisomerase 1
MSDLLKTKVEVPCPECGRKLRVTLGDIKQGRTVSCSGGHRVTLKDGGKGIEKVDKALNDVARKLNRLR